METSRALIPWTVLALLLACAAPAAAFEGEQALYEAARKEKELTWYTAHYNSESAAAVCNGFEKKYPGIKCNYIRTTAQVAYQRLAQDQKAGLAVASVFSSTDVSHYGRMKQDGWLQPYRPKNLTELIDAFKSFNDHQDMYVATAAGLVLLTYNTRLGGYEVNVSEQQLKGAPKFSKHENWDWSDRGRDKQVYDYYGVGPYWGS